MSTVILLSLSIKAFKLLAAWSKSSYAKLHASKTVSFSSYHWACELLSLWYNCVAQYLVFDVSDSIFGPPVDRLWQGEEFGGLEFVITWRFGSLGLVWETIAYIGRFKLLRTLKESTISRSIVIAHFHLDQRTKFLSLFCILKDLLIFSRSRSTFQLYCS